MMFNRKRLDTPIPQNKLPPDYYNNIANTCVILVLKAVIVSICVCFRQVNVIMLSIAIYMMCKHASSATSMKDKTKFQKFR